MVRRAVSPHHDYHNHHHFTQVELAHKMGRSKNLTLLIFILDDLSLSVSFSQGDGRGVVFGAKNKNGE